MHRLTVSRLSVFALYARINVEYFPNNHVFGLSNLDPEGIEARAYDALEPSIRVTDKTASNGFNNDGTLMVRRSRDYAKITNPIKGRPAFRRSLHGERSRPVDAW